MSTATLNYDLQKTIRLLPGYDPFEQAGDCRFIEEYAQAVLEFVQTRCTHVQGVLAGTPLLLEPWQQAIYANVWGWYRPDGTRRYREVLIFVPRGNSKTTMAASMVNVGLFLDQEPGAKIYSAAAEREQARLCFDIVGGMIRNEPWMDQQAEVLKYSIVVGDKSYRALSAEAGTKHGFNVHLLVNDELHAQRTPETTETLLTGTGKRTQPLVIHLTTSDYEREGSICNSKHDYASRVRDNGGDPAKPGYDPAFLPVIYEASKEDDWTDPAVWAKANPNLGISVPEDYIRRECARAREEPTYENTFRRLHLNVRTEQASRWMPMEKWDACVGQLDLAMLKGRPCWGGLDLASVEDMASFVLVFAIDGKYHVLPHYWAPADTAEKRQRQTGTPYVTWANQGFLTLTPGSQIDYGFIRHKISELAEIYQIREIAYDPWNAEDTRQKLEKEYGLTLIKHIQGAKSFNEPMKATYRAVLGGALVHGGHPVLRWNASNLVVIPDESENIRPLKNKATGKIDGMVALIMALGRAVAGEQGNTAYYEHHEVRLL